MRVAAVASSLVTQLSLGDEPIFRLPAYEVRSPLEMPLYLGLGLVASGMSLALVKLLAAGRSEPVQRWFRRLPPWLLTALGGLGLGGLRRAYRAAGGGEGGGPGRLPSANVRWQVQVYQRRHTAPRRRCSLPAL